jgi:ferredoxin
VSGTSALGRAAGHSRLLGVDPVACDGIGMCAHLAPRIIDLDPWGYPVLTGQPLDEADSRRATMAVAACPRRAMFIEDRPAKIVEGSSGATIGDAPVNPGRVARWRLASALLQRRHPTR